MRRTEFNHSTMTEMNHLGYSLRAKPDKLGGTMRQLFSSMRSSDNPLTAMLSGTGREEITSTNWEWELKGARSRPMVILQDLDPTNLRKGEFKSSFEIFGDVDWWVPGDILHCGAQDKRNQVRVQTKPRRHGNGYVYRVRLMTDDPTFALDNKYLKPMAKWNKLYSQYEEGSEQSGSTQYTGSVHLASRLSRFRKHYRVTGDVANEVLQVAIQGPKGKMHKSWIKYAEVEYWNQWYRELERGYWYGRSTDTVLGSTGRPVLSGPGVQELLERSNRHYYTQFNMKMVEDFLMGISYNRVSMKQGARKYKAFTGEYGALVFDRAAKEYLNKSGFIISMEQSIIQKDNSPWHTNGLSIGWQFTRYKLANGIELELVHNPLYDDTELNWEIDPITGYPKESMRFTFLDFSGEGKESNIRLMKKKNGMSLGYVAGLQSPLGPTNNALMSNAKDGYEVHVKDQCGVHIYDTSACGELIVR